MPIPIVDSHIHLFPESHLPTLAWHNPSGPLSSQHSIDEYRLATSSVPTSQSPGPESDIPHAQPQPQPQSLYLRGFIFLETDRISSIEEESESGWTNALDEVSLLTRIISNNPVPGEGHTNVDGQLCLAMVPWAPVPGGPALLERFLALVKERTLTDATFKKVRGFRYLVQDKQRGVMLQSGFVDGLKWLGQRNLVFDLGVDARQGGLWQLREAAEMMRMVYRGVEGRKGERVVIVINHLCKPNLRLPFSSPDSIATHPDFLEWSSLVTAMAQHPTTYMKLSGAFSEFPPLTAEDGPDVASLVEQLRLWTDVVFDAFGPERVMFGSDWPVCNVGGGGNAVAWGRWRSIVEGILEKRGLTREQKEGVWGGVAVKAYGIEL
ncbi:amidohydrolase family protein [Aspergillus heteromorphus CBS 117.55]|uniref:Amidohydrolase family protein n=1 Tax=Aspergillus heteromorphus CBS 117.55 TaxID=1448321 RepID=A0A317V962_9EURO|nr:amidohydrolase family protein [Aspergillus heteromorphus CBS 117.55]PWY69537.1 amidohydrolase family protein [Aspergillus heteromorphus CBS 117.55]